MVEISLLHLEIKHVMINISTCWSFHPPGSFPLFNENSADEQEVLLVLNSNETRSCLLHFTHAFKKNKLLAKPADHITTEAVGIILA